MAKYSAKIKDNYLRIKVKLSWGESLDEYQLDKMTEKKMHGFLRVEKPRRGTVVYCGPVAVSLTQWMSKPIDRFGFYFMMAQIVNAVLKVQDNGLLLNKLVLDPQYVYINETTREVQFIYLPLADDRARTDVMRCMVDLCNAAQFDREDDADCVSDFCFLLQRFDKFDALRIWDAINRREPKAISRLRRRNSGQSGSMSMKLDQLGMQFKKTKDEDDIPTGLMDDDDEDDIPTGLLGGGMDDDDDIPTGLLNGEWNDGDQPGGCMPGASIFRHVSLTREKTNETVEIERTMFRIGRSQSMDYTIRDNGKISRNHVEIITRGSRIFAVDLKSTGGTYLNGRLLYPDVEEEMHDGDCLRLANENFVFHIK